MCALHANSCIRLGRREQTHGMRLPRARGRRGILLVAVQAEAPGAHGRRRARRAWSRSGFGSAEHLFNGMNDALKQIQETHDKGKVNVLLCL